MNKMKEWKTKKKLVVGVVTLVCVGVVVGGATAVSAKNKEIARIEQKQDAQKALLDLLHSDLKAALDKTNEHYLVQGFSQEQMDSLSERKNKAVSIDDNDKVKAAIATVKESFEKVQTAYNRQEAVNSLYQKDDQFQAMDGIELKKDLAITDDLKKEIVTNVKDAYFVKDAKSDYDKTINTFITAAEDQVNQIETAKVAVSEIYNSTEEKVSSVDQELYDKAKTETEKIKNDKARNELLDKVSQVKEEMDKQAEAKKEQENAQQQATQAAQAPETEVPQENLEIVGESTGTATTGVGQESAPAQSSGTNVVPPSQTTPPATGSNNSWNQGASGGQITPPPASGGGNNNTGGGSTGGGSTPTAPAGTFGPFYSDEECLDFARSQGWKGYATIIIDGAMFISPR